MLPDQKFDEDDKKCKVAVVVNIDEWRKIPLEKSEFDWILGNLWSNDKLLVTSYLIIYSRLTAREVPCSFVSEAKQDRPEPSLDNFDGKVRCFLIDGDHFALSV